MDDPYEDEEEFWEDPAFGPPIVYLRSNVSSPTLTYQGVRIIKNRKKYRRAGFNR